MWCNLKTKFDSITQIWISFSLITPKAKTKLPVLNEDKLLLEPEPGSASLNHSELERVERFNVLFGLALSWVNKLGSKFRSVPSENDAFSTCGWTWSSVRGWLTLLRVGLEIIKDILGGHWLALSFSSWESRFSGWESRFSGWESRFSGCERK